MRAWIAVVMMMAMVVTVGHGQKGPLGMANTLITRTTNPLINGISNLLNLYQAFRPCQTEYNITGTCMPRHDCLNRGGQLAGPCHPASTVTICCDMKFTCGGRSDKNDTIFVNQNYPLPDNVTNTCQVTIEKQPNVCQIRLDFLEFKLSQPDDNGQCTTDSFMIRTTVGERLPILCGENDGQHMYIDVGSGASHSNPVVLSVVTNGEDQARRWRIQIRMIPCDSLSMAPSGCLQYHRSPSGMVQSFNYGPKISGKARYLANLRYTACMRTEENFCGIKWQTAQPDSFSWGWPFGSRNAIRKNEENGTLTDEDGGVTQLFASGNDCNVDDYVGIDQATHLDHNNDQIMALDQDRFCGLKLMHNDQVFSRSKPFQLKVRSNHDQRINAEKSQQGFSLRFTQLPCVL